MSGAVGRFDEGARRRVDGYGRTLVRDGELLRHPVYTRVLHWGVAIFFILALLTGLAIYSPWLYRALTPLFGGGAMTRLLHPWFSLGFVVVFALQFLNWVQAMTWTPDDGRWTKRLKSYVGEYRRGRARIRGLLQRRAEAVLLGDRRERHRLPRVGPALVVPGDIRPGRGGRRVRAARHRRTPDGRRVHRSLVRRDGRATGHAEVDDTRFRGAALGLDPSPGVVSPGHRARAASGGPAGPGASARAAAASLVGSAGISDTDFRKTA